MDPSGLFNVAAGGAMVVLALVLLAIDFASRVHRALAVFLVLRGVMNVLQGVIQPGSLLRSGEATLAEVLVPYFDIGVLAATLWFGWVFRARQRAAPPSRLAHGTALAAIAGAAAVAAVAYALDHGLYFGDGPGTPRPFISIQWLRMVAFAGLAVAFAWDAVRSEAATRRAAGVLAAAAFLLVPVVDTPAVGLVSVAILLEGRPIALAPPLLVGFVAAILGLAATATVVVARRGLPPERRAFVGSVVGGAAVGTAIGLVAFADVAAAARLFRAFDGVTSLAVPALLAVAVLRHRLFDMDPKVRWTISRGTVAALFVAVFFIASEAAAAFLQGWTGSVYVGIAAAGLLVFALAPLQRLADRAATAALPHAQPLGDMTREDRVALYREQVLAAWADGAMSRDERRLLEVAREKLRLTPEEVLLVEREAALP